MTEDKERKYNMTQLLQKIHENQEKQKSTRGLSEYSQLKENIDTIVSLFKELRKNATVNTHLEGKPETIENVPKEVLIDIFGAYTDINMLKDIKKASSYVARVNTTLRQHNVEINAINNKKGNYRIRYLQ